MLIITTIFASLLALIFVRLSLAVINLRRKNKVSLGSGEVPELENAMRAHGNFAEYVPITLLLMACLELNGAPWWLVSCFGISIVIGRVLHAVGIQQIPPNFSKRVRGMKITFSTIIGLAVVNLGWMIFRWFH